MHLFGKRTRWAQFVEEHGEERAKKMLRDSIRSVARKYEGMEHDEDTANAMVGEVTRVLTDMLKLRKT